MRKVWNQLFNIFKRFKSPKSAADSKLNKYDVAIVGLILFIGVYGLFMYVHPQNIIKEYIPTPIVTNKVPNKFMVPMKREEFVEGQFVGVRYFGIFGVIT